MSVAKRSLVSFFCVGATSTSWTADKDYLFLGAYVTVGTQGAVISADQRETTSTVIVPGTAKTISTVYFAKQASNANMLPFTIGIEVLNGTTLYLTTTGTTAVMMLLEEVDGNGG